MNGINEALNQAIKEEVTAKRAIKSAKDLVKLRIPVTRSRIEDIIEMAKLEAESLLDV